MPKNDISKHTGLLFELKIGLNRNNALVIDYGGKPVAKIREALKEYKYHANLCAAVINHANSVGKKMNPKQMRKIRHKAKAILLAWIKTVVKKDQHHTITPEKFSILIKNPSYYWQGRTLLLQPMSYRGIVQTLKKHPNWTIEDFNESLKPSEKELRRMQMAKEGPIVI